MCDRYFIKREKQEIADQMKAKKVFAEPYGPNDNILPMTPHPIVRQERDSEERELVLARWGLIPSFAKTLAEFKKLPTGQAKAEGVMTSELWRGPLRARRCLVPADGFYEMKLKDDAGKAKKQLLAISLKSGEPMAFAGLWDSWKEPKKSPQQTDVWLQSFGIVTVEANALLAGLATRMPVILAERDWAKWLDRDADAPPPVELLRPYDADEMTMEVAPPLVGNGKSVLVEVLESA